MDFLVNLLIFIGLAGIFIGLLTEKPLIIVIGVLCIIGDFIIPVVQEVNKTGDPFLEVWLRQFFRGITALSKMYVVVIILVGVYVILNKLDKRAIPNWILAVTLICTFLALAIVWVDIPARKSSEEYEERIEELESQLEWKVEDAKVDGYDKGYEIGYQYGKEEGYDAGYMDGLSDGQISQ